MPLSDTEFKQLMSDAEMGQFYQFSPTLQGQGAAMQKGAQKVIAEDRKTKDRAPINLGNGILYDQATGESTTVDAYGVQQEAQHKRKMEAQAAKDAEAFKRAEMQGIRSANQMPAGERKLYRLAQQATSTLPSILATVEANADAFGAGSSVGEYLPDGTPNWMKEGAKNVRQRIFTDEQQAARNQVYEQAYQIINQLAGAALSEHEANRLEGFLPSPNDDARTVANKIRNAVQTANRTFQSFDVYGGVNAPQAPAAPAAPRVVSQDLPRQPAEAAAPTPVGKPRKLGDGTVWQKFSDGSTKQVQ